MRGFRWAWTTAVVLTGLGAAAAEDGPQAKAASVVALAELAPTVCPGLTVKPESLDRWMAHAGITQQDVAGRYGEQTRRMALSFLATVHANRALACSLITKNFGDGGLGLLAETQAPN